ncbi:MAG TPA: type II toxin-antitoxin system prevent-host-death family antitoxin [Geobacteraceae bacterium]|nr:type II toxin-antitoxin system prevent-host-death family antitoxin [Geobacteraceae bacterium]
MDEMRVGIGELKSKWSEYMRRVKSGQAIVVTKRGEPIGQIVPINASIKARLHAMVAAGLAEWNGQKLKPYKPVAVNRGEGYVSDLVVEERR